MPIYEFFCPSCDCVMQFFARRAGTFDPPKCPHCGGTLEREVSLFKAGDSGITDEEHRNAAIAANVDALLAGAKTDEEGDRAAAEFDSMVDSGAADEEPRGPRAEDRRNPASGPRRDPKLYDL